MTIQEINDLIYTDIIGLLQSRLFAFHDIEPIDTLYFSIEELEAELVIYKGELLVIENERLRIKSLKDRFNALDDMRAAFHSIHSEPNPNLWLKEVLKLSSAEAEIKIAQLEEQDAAIKITPERIKSDWVSALKKDLADNNISEDGLLEAVVRSVILGDNTLIDALRPALISVNQRNKRP